MASDPHLDRSHPALEKPRSLLGELQLIRLGQGLHYTAQRRGHYDQAAVEALMGIADTLERHHGWDRERRNEWLEQLRVEPRDP